MNQAEALLVYRLYRNGRIGGRYMNEHDTPKGACQAVPQGAVHEAAKRLHDEGFLIAHQKGRLGKDECVSLNPESLTAALRQALPELGDAETAYVRQRHPAFESPHDPPRPEAKDAAPPSTESESGEDGGERSDAREGVRSLVREDLKDIRARLLAVEEQLHDAGEPSDGGRGVEDVWEEVIAIRNHQRDLEERLDRLEEDPHAGSDVEAKVAELTRNEEKMHDLVSKQQGTLEHVVGFCQRVSEELDLGEGVRVPDASTCWVPECEAPVVGEVEVLAPNGGDWVPRPSARTCGTHDVPRVLELKREHRSQFRSLAANLLDTYGADPFHVVTPRDAVRRDFLDAVEAYAERRGIPWTHPIKGGEEDV